MAKKPLLDITEYVWTVDNYCDRVAKRKKADVQKDIRRGYKEPLQFETAYDAWIFCAVRARCEAAECQAKSIRAKNREKRCEQKAKECAL